MGKLSPAQVRKLRRLVANLVGEERAHAQTELSGQDTVTERRLERAEAAYSNYLKTLTQEQP